MAPITPAIVTATLGLGRDPQDSYETWEVSPSHSIFALVAEEPKSDLRVGGCAHLRWELSQASCKTKRAETGGQTTASRHRTGMRRLC